MSPRPTVTPCERAQASRSSAWIWSPGSSQGTPRLRGDVEQDAPADDAVAGVGDVVDDRALAPDHRRVVAVVDAVFEDDVGERVPLGAGLERQDQQVVGAADPAVTPAVEVADDRARHRGIAVADHQVDRVEAAEAASLGAVLVDRDGQREDPSRADEARRPRRHRSRGCGSASRAGPPAPSGPSWSIARPAVGPSRCLGYSGILTLGARIVIAREIRTRS